MDNYPLRTRGHHRRGGVLFLLPACVRVTGQVAGALCSGKERRRPDRGQREPSGTSSSDTDKVIGAEIAILTSWDLAVQVAQAIGPRRLLPPSTDLLARVARRIGLKQPSAAATETAAAGVVSSGLSAVSTKGSNIILVSYKNGDPQIAPLVLQELLSRYFIKHLEVHRSAGAFDFVTQQTDQVRARLNQTEDALKALRDKTGITSLKDGLDALTDETAEAKKQLNAAETDLLEQQALATQLGKEKARAVEIKGGVISKDPGQRKGPGRRHTGKDRGV